MAIKITDLVDAQEIDKLKALDAELKRVLETYTNVARGIASGLEINVKVAGDIDKIERLLIEKGKEAAAVQQQLTSVVDRQAQAVANTTNTISRHLMEQERLNKTQRDAYTEGEKVKKLLEHIHDTYEEQTKRLVVLNQQLAANKKEQQANERAMQSGAITAKQYTTTQAQLIAEHRALTQEKRQLTQIMTAEEKAAMSADDTYAHMSQQLELLKKAYKEMSAEGRNSEMGKELEAAIQSLDAHLKDMAADMGEFQRNVGNYAIAGKGLKTEYDNLIGTLATLQNRYNQLSQAEKESAQGQQLAQEIEQTAQAARDTYQSLQQHTAALQDAKAAAGETSAAHASVKQDLKELVLEIANLSIEYQNLSEEEKNSAQGQALAQHIQELTEQAGVLKDAISDTNAAIANAASDTRGLDQVGGALQLAIDGFGLAQGAAAMLGISEGELAEIQTKLQAAIAASNAMQSIQNALQSQSALMQGVSLAQTKLRTIAENLHTAAQGKGLIATKLLTAAQWGFNAAATANPIGLLIVGITACIAVVYGLIKAFQAFFGASKDEIKQYQAQKKALDDLCDAHDKLLERRKAKGATEAELNRLSLEHTQEETAATDALFKRASKLYKKNSDEYKEALEAKKAADEEYAAAQEDMLNYLERVIAGTKEEEARQAGKLYEYKMQLIQSELIEQKRLAQLLLEQGKITEDNYAKLVAQLDAAAQVKANKVEQEEKKSTSSRASAISKGADELKKAVQAGEDALLNLITDSLERQQQAEILSYNRRLKELQDSLAKTKSSNTKMRQAINNQIQGLEAEHADKMAQIQQGMNDRRLKAEQSLIDSHLSITKAGTEEHYQWTLKKLEKQYEAELIELQKSVDDKTLTEEQGYEMRLNMAEKYAADIEAAEGEHNAAVAAMIEERYSREQAERDNQYIAEVNALKQKYADELAAAKGNAAAQAQITEQLETEQARLAEQYAVQTAQATVEMLQEGLKQEGLTAEERLKYEQALAKAKCDLETAMADKSIAEIKRVNEADAKSSEARKANAQTWLQVASDSLNTISELVSTVYDAKIEKIEEEQESNTAASEAEMERISELVENQVITEEEGEARKRAAEAETASKNEELEKKKSKLKHQQAVWDKANGIAQAGISTALAIMSALAQFPGPVGIALAAVAGAMGAIQIATILATPIPKYAKGTPRHKGGPAIVGDGGVAEVVMFEGKSWVTPDRPTLVDMPAGAVVLPNLNGIDDKVSGLTPLSASASGNNPVIIQNDYSRLEGKMDAMVNALRRHSARQNKTATELAMQNYIKGK